VIVNWDVTLDYTKSENDINVKLCKCGIGTSCEFMMSVHLSNAIVIVIKCKFTCTLVLFGEEVKSPPSFFTFYWTSTFIS
jgi:hypothetical protein